MARPPELIDDVFGEILLRLPPDDPACLIRASLVCKPWRRLLSDPAFLRRYRAFHGAPPLLGFFRERSLQGKRFIATTAPSPIAPLPMAAFEPHARWSAMDCRHGRVLRRVCFEPDLVVWDPITGDQHRVPATPPGELGYPDAAAVLCGVAGCDHLDCRGGPFLVVVLCTYYGNDGVKRASIYSSETGEWSASTSVELRTFIDEWPSLLIGEALYFGVNCGMKILEYDLVRRSLSVIRAPAGVYWRPGGMGIVVTGEDNRLGFAGLKDDNLHLWLRQAGADGKVRWTKDRVVKVEMLPLPILEPSTSSLEQFELCGFIEGTDTVIMRADVGIFTIMLNSREIRKLDDNYANTLPYKSFYTPDLAKGRMQRP